MLKTQELENVRQAAVIDQQGEMINRLEETLTSMDPKCKLEVMETGKNKLLRYFIVFYFIKTFE